MTKELSFRTKAGNFLGSNVVLSAVVLGFALLTLFIDDDLAYFLGLAYVLLLLWSKRWEWGLIGLLKPESWKKVWLKAVVVSILLVLLVDVILTPVIEYSTGVKIDISSIDGIRGNFPGYLLLIAFMWIIAAFGEEFVYRGLLVQRLGTLLGNTNAAFWIAVLCSSILFSFAHKYQGISGMISTGIVGFALGAVYVNSKDRLWLTILSHGIYDTILITLIYLDIDNHVFYLLENLF